MPFDAIPHNPDRTTDERSCLIIEGMQAYFGPEGQNWTQRAWR